MQKEARELSNLVYPSGLQPNEGLTIDKANVHKKTRSGLN